MNGQSGHHAGRLLLSEMYREQTGCEMPEITIQPKGKPCFSQGNYHFSISHTPAHVFCALSDRPVGIDAEEADRLIDLRLSHKILSDAEYERYQACTDQRDALLRFWVLKEASVKLSGEGLQGYPSHTDFSPDDPRIFLLDGCLVAMIQQEESHAF